jgi:tetratricopeptide (TPR) repeat protein
MRLTRTQTLIIIALIFNLAISLFEINYKGILTNEILEEQNKITNESIMSSRDFGELLGTAIVVIDAHVSVMEPGISDDLRRQRSRALDRITTHFENRSNNSKIKQTKFLTNINDLSKKITELSNKRKNRFWVEIVLFIISAGFLLLALYSSIREKEPLDGIKNDLNSSIKKLEDVSNKQLAEAWHNRGLALEAQGKYDEAYAAFAKAIDLGYPSKLDP